MSRFGFGFQSGSKVNVLDVIDDLNLRAGLKLCLDAHDVQSFSGSGPSWLDRSGGGYDFFRGANATASADDPSFNGSANSPSSYWSFDGGDLFRYESTNETWMQNIHKDNAKVTCIAWVYPVAGVNNIVLGTNGGPSVSGTGFHFGIPSTNTVALRVANGTGSSSQENASVAVITNATWNFIAASIDEQIAFGAYQVNATKETFSSTYASPSASSASYTMEVGARGNANSVLPNGSRLACLAVWEGVALTQAQIDSVFQNTRGLYGV